MTSRWTRPPTPSTSPPTPISPYSTPDTCDATIQSGCATHGHPAGDSFGDGPSGIEIDPHNDTLYTANGDETISAWDLARCNATDLAGCANQTPGTVTPFPDSNAWPCHMARRGRAPP